MDFEEHNFDGDFQMDVPYGSAFQKTSSFFGIDIGSTKVFQDFENDLNISYTSVNDYESYFNDVINALEKEPNVNVTHEDDLYLITTEKYKIILFNENQKIIAISASDLEFNEMKKMAHSVC